MKKFLWVLMLLGSGAWADDLQLKVESSPPDAVVSLVRPGGLKDRNLPHHDQIWSLPRQQRGELRFTRPGYRELVQSFTLQQLSELSEPPDQPGVKLYPPVRLQPEGGVLAQKLLQNAYWWAPLLLVFGVLSWRRYQEVARERGRLQRVESYATGDPMAGRRLGEYLITARLGSGGMATVYRAIPYDSLDESQAVALKVILEERRDEEFFQRFRREVEVTRSLNHANTLRLFGWGEDEGLFYLVMELVEGKPLRPPPGGLSTEQFRLYLPGLLDGLIYAHDQGIVHRDLKPDNLMVMSNGQIKVMDFGLARSHEMKTVTATGTALGTPAYMPPEQILGESPTPLSDQYSLGVTFYEMLCGRRPFEHEELMALIQAQLSEEAMPPSLYRDDLPLELEQVVMQMMCKDPARRFRDLGAVRVALEEAFAVIDVDQK